VTFPSRLPCAPPEDCPAYGSTVKTQETFAWYAMLLMLAEERTGSQPSAVRLRASACHRLVVWPQYRPQKILRVHEPEREYPHPSSILIQLCISRLQILLYSHLVSCQTCTCLKLDIRIVEHAAVCQLLVQPRFRRGALQYLPLTSEVSSTIPTSLRRNNHPRCRQSSTP
jgi:hypothetical protein